MTVLTEAAVWTDVCAYDDLPVEQGVCALVDGAPVAIVRTYDGALFAVGNVDPASGASVMSRGIVGTRAGRPTIASPMFKHVYDLATGQCCDDGSLCLTVYRVRDRSGRVEVACT